MNLTAENVKLVQWLGFQTRVIDLSRGVEDPLLYTEISLNGYDWRRLPDFRYSNDWTGRLLDKLYTEEQFVLDGLYQGFTWRLVASKRSGNAKTWRDAVVDAVLALIG